MNLLAFYDNFIIVEDNNGNWLMPNRIIKLSPKIKEFCLDVLPYDVSIDSQDITSLNTQIIRIPIQWSYKFEVGFAYCKQIGVLGII